MGKQIKQPKLQILHESLVRDGYDVPADYAVFERNLADENKSKTLFGALQQDQYDVPGDYDTFARNLEVGSYVKKKDSTGSEDLSTTGLPPSPELKKDLPSIDKLISHAKDVDDRSALRTPDALQVNLPPAENSDAARSLVAENYKNQNPEEFRERNPITTPIKSFWNEMSFNLPAGLAATGAILATSQQGGDIPIFNTPTELETTSVHAAKKDLVNWALERQGKGAEFSKDLVNTLEKVNDPIDALNWMSATIGTASAQIPLAVGTVGMSSMSQEVGSIYLDGVRQIAESKGLTPDQVIDQKLDEPAFAIAYGVTAGFLDKIGAGKVMSSFSKGAVKKGLRSRAMGILESGAVESGTEYTQTFLEQLGATQVEGKSFGEAWDEAQTSEAVRNRLEAAAQGLVGGGALHAAGGAIDGKKKAEPVTQDVTPVTVPEENITETPEKIPVEEKIAHEEPKIVEKPKYEVIPRSTKGLVKGENFDYMPNKSLSEEDKGIETKFADDLNKNFEERKAEYVEKFGNVLDADNAKELSEEYKKDPQHMATAVHNPGSSFLFRMYTDMLKEPAPKGKENKVTFIVGGAGAGKSTLTGTLKEDSKSQIIYNTLFGELQISKNQVNRALNADKDVEIKYVYRDPEESFTSMIERSDKGRRIVPLKVFVKSHVDSQRTMMELADTYKGNDRVNIETIGGPGAKMSEGDLIESLTSTTEKLYSEGKITEGQYTQLLGKPPDEDAGNQTGDKAPIQPEITPDNNKSDVPAEVSAEGDVTEVAPVKVESSEPASQKAEFEWLGVKKKGVIVGEKNGKIKIKSDGTIFTVSPVDVKMLAADTVIKPKATIPNTEKKINKLAKEIKAGSADQNKIARHGKLTKKLQKLKMKRYEGEQGSPEVFKEPPIGAPTRKSAIPRVQVSPIYGGKPKLLRDIILDMSKGIKNQVFYSKTPIQGRRSAGSYNPSNAAIAIKYKGDLDVTAHELGHALDDQFAIVKSVPMTQQSAVNKELNELSVYGSKPPAGHPNPQRYRQAEGMAEYIRAYLVNPQKAEQQFPETSAWIKQSVPAETLAEIAKFGTDVRTYAGLTAHDQIMSNTQFDAEKQKGGLASFFKPSSADKTNFRLTWMDRLAHKVTNDKVFFEKAVDFLEAQQGNKLNPEADPRMLARVVMGSNEKLDNIFEKGLVNSRNQRVRDKVTNQQMNFEWLLQPFENTNANAIRSEQQEAITYMVAERTMELAKRFGRDNILSGIGAGIFRDTDVAARRLLEHEAQSPEKQARIEEAARRYREWADRVLKYMVDKGRLSIEQYNQIKADNIQYVALQRIQETAPGEEVVVYHGDGTGSIGSRKNVLKKIKGSSALIKNPYESLVETTIKAIKEADNNEVMQAFRELFQYNRSMYQDEPKHLAQVARPATSKDKNTVSVFVDGEQEYWQLEEDVYKSVKSIIEGTRELPAGITLIPRILRWSVTNFPVFAIRNRIRDIQQRMIVSDTKGFKGYDIYFSKGTKELTKESFQLFGGGQAGYYLINKDFYYKKLQQATEELTKDKKTILLDPAKMAKAALNGYDALLSAGERATRLEEYRSAFKFGKSKGMDDYNASIFAAYKARDLLDFSVAGEYLRLINQVIPFSNAAVQGLKKTYTSAADNPGAFAIRFTMYAVIPALITRALIHQWDKDEEYANLPNYRRDLFYNIPLGPDMWLTIPKPFELGVMSTGVERVLSKYAYDEKGALDGYYLSLAKSIWPVDDAAMAGPLRSMVEITANYDYFRDNHIIPPDQENLKLEYRDTDKASRIGQALQSIVGTDARLMDHLVKSSTSYFGDFAVRASDIGRDDSRNKFSWASIGLIKNDPLYESKDVQWVLTFVKEEGIHFSDPYYQEMNAMISTYYEAVDKTERAEIAKSVREFARLVKEEYQSNDYYKRENQVLEE